MKRVVVLVLAVMLSLYAVADSGIRWADMSDEDINSMIAEFTEIINEAQAELDSRKGVQTYQIDGLVFSVDFYRQPHKGVFGPEEYVICKIEWENQSSQAASIMDSIYGYAYQNGKEISASTFMNAELGGADKRERILPGYSATSFYAFKIKDESDMKIVFSDLFHQRDLENGIVFDVKLAELEQYQ